MWKKNDAQTINLQNPKTPARRNTTKLALQKVEVQQATRESPPSWKTMSRRNFD